MNWTALTSTTPSGLDKLASALEGLSVEELESMLGARAPRVEEFLQKLATADQLGRELVDSSPDLLKTAGPLASAGKMLAQHPHLSAAGLGAGVGALASKDDRLGGAASGALLGGGISLAGAGKHIQGVGEKLWNASKGAGKLAPGAVAHAAAPAGAPPVTAVPPAPTVPPTKGAPIQAANAGVGATGGFDPGEIVDFGGGVKSPYGALGKNQSVYRHPTGKLRGIIPELEKVAIMGQLAGGATKALGAIAAKPGLARAALTGSGALVGAATAGEGNRLQGAALGGAAGYGLSHTPFGAGKMTGADWARRGAGTALNRMPAMAPQQLALPGMKLAGALSSILSGAGAGGVIGGLGGASGAKEGEKGKGFLKGFAVGVLTGAALGGVDHLGKTPPSNWPTPPKDIPKAISGAWPAGFKSSGKYKNAGVLRGALGGGFSGIPTTGVEKAFSMPSISMPPLPPPPVNLAEIGTKITKASPTLLKALKH